MITIPWLPYHTKRHPRRVFADFSEQNILGSIKSAYYSLKINFFVNFQKKFFVIEYDRYLNIIHGIIILYYYTLPEWVKIKGLNRNNDADSGAYTNLELYKSVRTDRQPL